MIRITNWKVTKKSSRNLVDISNSRLVQIVSMNFSEGLNLAHYALVPQKLILIIGILSEGTVMTRSSLTKMNQWWFAIAM